MQPVGVPVDATPARLPQPISLKGTSGSLEKLDPARHGQAIWAEVKGHDDVWAYLFHGPFTSKTEFDAYLRMVAAREDPFAYAILNSNGRALGFATLMEIRPAHRVVEVGNILYAPALQRTKLATEAQYLLMRYAFEELGYRRYEWKCNSLNEPSRRAALRYGFTFEGIFRQHMIVKGRNRDTAWFSITDQEWPAIRRGFEEWLSSANFDADGKQKKKLEGFRA